jgi:uncharacterized protein YcfL
MKTLLHLFLAAVSTLLFLSLCQADSVPLPNEIERVITLEEFFAPPADKVVSTADSIVVNGVKTKYIKGFLKVDFKLRNNRGRRNVINYRVQWLDSDAVMVGEYSAWLTVAFEGQQEMIVSALSPMNNAVDYRLELQSN